MPCGFFHLTPLSYSPVPTTVAGGLEGRPCNRSGAEGEGEMTMKALVILTAVCFSTSAYAQGAPPKAGNKPLLQVKPKEPMECKLVGKVKGTKLWAGDCAGPELRGAIPSTETQSVPVPEPPTGAIPPDQKE